MSDSMARPHTPHEKARRQPDDTSRSWDLGRTKTPSPYKLRIATDTDHLSGDQACAIDRSSDQARDGQPRRHPNEAKQHRSGHADVTTVNVFPPVHGRFRLPQYRVRQSRESMRKRFPYRSLANALPPTKPTPSGARTNTSSIELAGHPQGHSGQHHHLHVDESIPAEHRAGGAFIPIADDDKWMPVRGVCR